jgi:membrane-bound ClpP family serine protease
MNLDIKIPIGLLFTILGVLLTIFGLTTLGETELYSKSLNININLWTGLSMVVIGVFLLVTAKWKKEPARQEKG